MNKINRIKGTAIPMNIDDIDTDIIIPAQYLTNTSQQGFGQHAFARLKAEEDFVLNHEKYQGASVLLTGSNFGCGSSREHAVWAIQELGISAVIAPSFADIFSNNAKKNGLLLIQLPKEAMDKLMHNALQELTEIDIDVEKQQLFSNAEHYDFDIEPFFKHCLTHGLDELDYLMSHINEIKSFKQQQINQTLFIQHSS